METLLSNQQPILPYIEASSLSARGVAVDSFGNVYFGDQSKSQIFKINGEEIIVFAGSGENGLKDGTSMNAQFSGIMGFKIDSEDNLYVCDTVAIRKIKPDGTVSTLVTKIHCWDVAIDEDRGYLYIADDYFIQRIDLDGKNLKIFAGSKQYGFKDGNGTAAQFDYIHGIASMKGSGDLYVAEFWNQAIRKVTPSGQVSTVLRNIKGRPMGIEAFNEGQIENLIFVEYFGHKLFRYDLNNATLETLAGNGGSGTFDGAGTDAVFTNPTFLARNPIKNEVFVTEWSGSLRVMNKFKLVSTFIRPEGSGYIDGPGYMTRFSSLTRFVKHPTKPELYIADAYNNVVRKFDLNTRILSTFSGMQFAGSADGDVKDALFSGPQMLTMYDDLLYINDFDNKAIRMINLTSSKVSTLFKVPSYNAITLKSIRNGTMLALFRNFQGDEVHIYGTDGLLIDDYGAGAEGCLEGHESVAKFQFINGMTEDELGMLYMADLVCEVVIRFDPSTRQMSFIAGTATVPGYKDGPAKSSLFTSIYDIAYSKEEKLFYICDGNKLRMLSQDGIVSTLTGKMEAGYRNGNLSTALFHVIQEIHLDSSNGDKYILDRKNHALRVLRSNGRVETLVGFGAKKFFDDSFTRVDLRGSRGMSLVDDNLYVANTGESTIIKINIKTKNASLVAGDGGFGWLDGKGNEAMLNRPEGIVFSPSESIFYIADTQNHLIRRMTLDGVLTTFAGSGNFGSKSGTGLLSAEFNKPSDLAIGPNGDIFVSDMGNHVIRRITKINVSLYAGSFAFCGYTDGRLLGAKFTNPTGIIYDELAGILLIVDSYNHVIRFTNSTHVGTFSGNGSYGQSDGIAKSSTFAYPNSITLSGSGKSYYVSDSFNRKIRKIDKNGDVSTLQTDIPFKFPCGIHESSGVLYMGDSRKNSIYMIPIELSKSSKSNQAYNLNNDSGQIVGVALGVLGLALSCLAIIYTIYYKGRMRNTKALIMKHGNREVAKGMEATKTMTLEQTAAISLPGYLNIPLKKTVKLSYDRYGVAGVGGTASIQLGKLINLDLIKKHEFVDVAVKFMQRDVDLDSFRYEIIIMHSLPKSPFIAEIVSYCEKSMAIVMKAYPINLVDFILGNTSINDSTTAKLARDIATGMSLMHSKGVIHFDLKPGNILIEASENFHAVICDFGFANFSRDARKNLVNGVLRPNTVGITARYAAPELFNYAHAIVPGNHRLDEEDDKKVDVFAYAMVLYFIYTKSKPWQEIIDLLEIEKLVLEGFRPKFTPSVNGNMVDLIERCWSQSPNDRPSFTEILSILGKQQ